LTVFSKSQLLHALMMMRPSHLSGAESAVENLLLRTHGDTLSELKSLSDGRGDIHSMIKLVFQDISDGDIRKRVLNHFLAEAASQVAHRTLSASCHFRWLMQESKRHKCVPKDLDFVTIDDEVNLYSGDRFPSWLKILFDIGDTLTCSGGEKFAGIDKRYPRKAVYPGVIAFLSELQGASQVSHLVALTARPHLFGNVVEKNVYKRFRRLIQDHGLPVMPHLLPGGIDTGLQFIARRGDDRGKAALAKKKFDSYYKYLSLYPEFRVVFMGDNGQGDYLVAQTMHEYFPDNLEQVWIQKVQPESDTPFYTPDSKAPIQFVEDYVEAAVQAATRHSPLITPEGLFRVARSAKNDFEKITDWVSEHQRATEKQRLALSLAQAREVLLSFGIEDAENETLLKVSEQPVC